MLIKHVASNSKGNLYTIDESIIIDCGVSFSFLDEKIDFQSFGFLLLTHEHADHLNKVALRKVFTRSKIKIVCGEWLHNILLSYGFDEDRIMVVEFGKVYQLDDYKISPVKAYHDVENCGYRIMQGNHKHLHITDTSTLDGIVALDYDTATIECNHDEFKALELIAEAKENGEFTHLKGAINSHLSVQQTIQFCDQNRVKQLYPAHLGSSTKKEVIQALREWINT